MVPSFDEGATKVIPEVERIRTNYYEDGIDSFHLSLKINKIVAFNKLNGKEMTQNDILKIMLDAQGSINDRKPL